MNKQKLIRITTVPLSLDKLLSGQLNYMNSFYDVTAVSSEKEYLERIGTKEMVSTFHVDMTRQITPLKDFMSVVNLYKFLKKSQPLIVHTHTPKAGIVGMLASKLAGVPYRLHTVAGLPLLETTGFKRKVLDFVEKLTYSCATNVYPNSYGLLDIINQNQYCNSGKLKVLANGSSNGIDTSFFNPTLFSGESKLALKEKLGINEGDFIYVFVGRIVKDKGINELVEAFDRISKINPKCKLILVGPLEHDLDPIDALTQEIILKNKSILSVGYQNDVRPYFSISHALVFPSYREGFPNVVMQAGAMGLPCIVTNINGCNEIIKDCENGIIIPVKDAEAIYKSMLLLLNDESLFNNLIAKARHNIVSLYEQRVVWESIYNEYRELQKNK